MPDNSNVFKIKGISPLNHGASRGRRMGDWGTRRAGPTDEVVQDLAILQSRSRQLRRNNAWVSRAIIVGVASEIGTGIKPSPNTGDDKLNSELKELYVAWSKFADYTGQLTAYGLQAAMVVGRKEAGECFMLVRRNRVDRTSENPVPLEFQLVESDQVANDLTVNLLSGNIIRNGVETTRNGKVMAYWFHKEHPDERGVELRGKSTMTNRVRVPATDVIHHFRPERPSQLRGRPETARAIVLAKNYEEYADSELMRKKTRSDLTGVIEKPDLGEGEYEIDPLTGQPYDRDADGVPLLDLEPGTFPSLLPGEKLNLFPSDQTGQGFGEYQRWNLLAISAAMNVPYQLISQDYTLINDRLYRAILNNYKREIQQTQELYIIPQVCNRMWVEFVKRAIVAGVVKVPSGVPIYKLYQVEHRPQTFAYIHPQQDVAASIAQMQAGLKSRSAIIDEITGGDESSISIDAQRAIDLARENELGLKSLANRSTLDSTMDEDEANDQNDEDQNDDDQNEGGDE